MDGKGVRILSLEARDIYTQVLRNGEDVGYVMPDKKDFVYFRLFKNVLDFSLDLVELQKVYEKKCRKSFTFSDDKNNLYTTAIINVKFNYAYKLLDVPVMKLKAMREYLYEKGFMLGGVRYVRYKRSSGSSRQGKCLFIDERLYDSMAKWGECGLRATNDLASWESYKSLSLSALQGLVKIPFEGILFIPDYKSAFEEEVISVEESQGNLIAARKTAEINNDIWDGESLLDESLFCGEYADKHMLLLRNKFFKSCAFKTKLQKWFSDKNVTLDELNARGFITFAKDVSQIVMVTTPNSMKFLKFMAGGFTQENIRRWMDKVDDEFGVVKYDKRTKFFGGKMVQTSYQFINTLGMAKSEAKTLLQPSKDYVALIRNDFDFMRYHFTDAYKRESVEKTEISDGLAERSEVFFKLMKVNTDFKETKLYSNFKNEVIGDQKQRLKEGHVLLSGTNATLFGNGPEMLLAISGEFDLHSKNASSVLQKGEVVCKHFADGKRLVCARSPHITMGNLYCVKNNLGYEIFDYFDLGENIVCVNAIGENIQQRLNGCDYDSDTMLMTDDELIVEIANRHEKDFLVPVCKIEPSVKENQTLAELDHTTSANKIGHIVNLSQKLNSILWDRTCKGEGKGIDEIYRDICILAVLSGIEIDKAKRAYPHISIGAELYDLSFRYSLERPKFFKTFDKQDVDRRVRYIKDAQERKKKREELKEKHSYAYYCTAMEYVCGEIKEIDFRKSKPKEQEYLPLLEMLTPHSQEKTSTVYAQRDRIVEICQGYAEQLSNMYKELGAADDDEKEVLYETIQQTKAERNEKISKILTNEYLLYLVLKKYEKEGRENWHLFAPVLGNPMFIKLLKESKEKLKQVVEADFGEYQAYQQTYTKI